MAYPWLVSLKLMQPLYYVEPMDQSSSSLVGNGIQIAQLISQGIYKGLKLNQQQAFATVSTAFGSMTSTGGSLADEPQSISLEESDEESDLLILPPAELLDSRAAKEKAELASKGSLANRQPPSMRRQSSYGSMDGNSDSSSPRRVNRRSEMINQGRSRPLSEPVGRLDSDWLGPGQLGPKESSTKSLRNEEDPNSSLIESSCSAPC
ncbi:uncharacterized protein LOC107367464 [Tetranychus urticae]|uniref:uncharacterized protein LOC107367464 n=1 Tax=Tetranychus urticae TaxID=32264 RepID=UPI00077BE5E7|nr:uncharacterized protein LOC107367464 [Tetranychus urticae]